MLHYKTYIRFFSSDSLIRFLRNDSLIRFLRNNKFKIPKIDCPFFNIRYFGKKNLVNFLFKNYKNKAKLNLVISPQFYGNFVTILAQKI